MIVHTSSGGADIITGDTQKQGRSLNRAPFNHMPDLCRKSLS